MTAEIGILNKSAVALATDSAVSIEKKDGYKIFNTANKLFMLSKYQPVGIMIFDSAEFMGVPWETIIKIYRKKLSKKVYEHLKQYIQDVFKKAAINKGSKIYEHGLSLEHTAKLLGTSQWELSEYIGQKHFDVQQVQTIDIKERAKMALEFFS